MAAPDQDQPINQASPSAEEPTDTATTLALSFVQGLRSQPPINDEAHVQRLASAFRLYAEDRALDPEAKYLLEDAAGELDRMRRLLEIANARIDTFRTMERLFLTYPYSGGTDGDTIDTAWRLRRKAQQLHGEPLRD